MYWRLKAESRTLFVLLLKANFIDWPSNLGNDTALFRFPCGKPPEVQNTAVSSPGPH